MTVTEGDSGSLDANFTVSLTPVSGRQVTVQYATANGSAIAPGDYTATSGSLTFAPGQMTKTVSVPVNGDALDEIDETFNLNLSVPANATILDAVGLGTIVDNDGLPSLSVNDVTVTEGNGGGVNAVFTVSLTSASGQVVSVDYATADGTATAGADYTATSGNLIFTAGQTTRTITVPTSGDLLDEIDETFTIGLSNPVNAAISDPLGLGTITDNDATPTLTAEDVTVTEGNSGTVNATFAVDLSAPSGRAVSVDFATANGSAIAPADYVATSGTLDFAAGQTAKTVTVVVNGDVLDEINETFTTVLSNPTNATIADGTGVGTITDDDPQPELSINDATVAEGNAGTVDATFTVTLSSVSGRTVTVNYASANTTATAPADYTAVSGTLTFASGETTKTITVTVNGDLLDEADETFAINLSNASGATVTVPQGHGTITDDDPLPTLTINDVPVTEGSSGTTAANFTVTLSAPSGRTVSVGYATANGTAISPGDYQAGGGTLTFAPGQTSLQIPVQVVGDLDDEASETYFLNLSGPTNATVTDPQGVGTIIDDDGEPTLSVNDVTVTEGQSGIVNANFAVTLSAPSGQTISVGYATADGTATAGSDYIATGGNLVFNPGITSRTLTVQVTSDTLDELDETFLANLTDPANATIADGQGVGTITDDDNPPSLSIGDVTVTEGQSGTVPATFTATLSAQSGRTVTVDFATANGTATAPADYQATVGSLSFPPGVTTRTITVLVKGDTLDEADETYSVDLSNPGNGTIADAQALGTITDDDPAPTISIGDATVTEGDAGTANATFTVDLSTASGRPASVDFATASGSATAPADYQTTSGPLNFAVGETTKTVTVLVNGDLLDEIDETFTVNLSNAVGATIADGLGLGTITDNDPLPALSVNDVTVTEGDSGTVAAAFTVSLSVPSGRSVTVGYATANGSAIAPADFIAGTGTLTFAAGQTTQQAVVLVNGDLLDEVTESFFLNLSGPTNATLSDAQAVGTIIDDDGLPSLSVNDVTVTEGQSGTVNANFTVTLSASSGQTVSVGYSTADGTATAGADYNAGGGNLVFSPGVTTRTLTVQVTSDTLDELDETFFANLADPNNAEIADGQGVGTITDDDNPPSVSIGDVTVAEGNTGNANATFTVALSAASGRTVTVDYATANGTAIAPGDYAAVPLSTLTFNPGQTSRTLTVLVNGDALDEVNETYLVDLSNATNSTIADPQAIGTITDDDPFPAVSVSDATVTEGDGATAAATFTVTLNAPSGRVLSVDFATGDGSAIAPADYAAATGTLTFLAGETTKTVNVLAAGDTLDEIDETFTLSLSNAVNVTVADGLGLGTITDNDPLPTLSINDVTVTEGDSGPVVATFTVSMNVPSGRAASVGYATADGTATAPGDYTSASGTLNFAAGQTTRTFTVNVNGDVTDELDETFTVTLSTPVNATILDGQGVGTITDDDGFPSLSINDVTVTETNSSVNAVFNVTLSNASGQTVSVAYATADGTARRGCRLHLDERHARVHTRAS